MRILVVTPTLGSSPWLAETIASVAALPFACQHVLVAPLPVVPMLAERYPETTVVTEPGGGMYAAINAGISAVTDWDAFTYINDDDLLLPALAAAADVMASVAESPVIVYGRVRLIDSKGRRLGAIPVSPRPSLIRALYAERLEPVYQHGTLVSRSALAALGGFDPAFRFCGDSEFLARACVNGIPFVRTKGEVAAFRLRAGQLTKSRAAMTLERSRVDEKLGLLAGIPAARRRFARAAFRLANLDVYAERTFRHGFVSFDRMLERLG